VAVVSWCTTTSEPPLRGDEGTEMTPTEDAGGEMITGGVGGAGYRSEREEMIDSFVPGLGFASVKVDVEACGWLSSLLPSSDPLVTTSFTSPLGFLRTPELPSVRVEFIELALEESIPFDPAADTKPDEDPITLVIGENGLSPYISAVERGVSGRRGPNGESLAMTW